MYVHVRMKMHWNFNVLLYMFRCFSMMPLATSCFVFYHIESNLPGTTPAMGIMLKHLRPESPSSQRTGPRTGMFDGDVHLDLLSCIYLASIMHRLDVVIVWICFITPWCNGPIDVQSGVLILGMTLQVGRSNGIFMYLWSVLVSTPMHWEFLWSKDCPVLSVHIFDREVFAKVWAAIT